MSTSGTTRTVGVDLQDSEENRTLVQAIQKDNTDAHVSHLPGLVKIQVPSSMTIRRETVEALLGHDWETQEFQMAIVSYYGNIDEWDDDQIIIKWRH